MVGPITRSRRVWQHRRVLALLIRRDLKVRYADSVLGYVWSVVDPLMMGLIYWFVFAAIFQRSVGEDPYILYLLAGMLPFNMWFQATLNGAAKTIKGERLVRSTALPREIWVLRLVFSKGIEYALSLPVLAVFAAVYQKGVNWNILLMIPAVLLQTVLLIGGALLLAALGALVRDVDRAIRIINRMLFYGTPILYGIDDVLERPSIPDVIKDLYYLNPMTGIVSLYRAGMFSIEMPFLMIASSVTISVTVFALGWWVFARLESSVLKEI